MAKCFNEDSFVNNHQIDWVIDIREVCRLTSLSRSSVYEKMKIGHRNYDPSFPTKIVSRCLGRRARWFCSAILDWLKGLNTDNNHKN
jgi:predicted DNA-binding transcriptional regulator AlpA